MMCISCEMLLMLLLFLLLGVIMREAYGDDPIFKAGLDCSKTG